MKGSRMLKRGVQLAVCAALALSMGSGAALAKGKLGGGDEKVKGDFVWSIEANCVQCHEKQGKSMDDAKLLANEHGSLDCLFCHDYEVPATELAAEVDAEGEAPKTLEEAHAKVDTVEIVKRNSLRNTVVQEEACLTCHNLDDLKDATVDCVVLKDANGLVVNPHDLVAGEQHSSITCSSCHVMHSADPAAAYRACVSCHHAEVWECGTCHTYTSDVSNASADKG